MDRIEFTSEMLLDGEGGSGLRRVLRAARATSGHEEIEVRLKKVTEKWVQYGAAAWNDSDRLIASISELGELCLIVLSRFRSIYKEEPSESEDDSE